MKVEIFSDVVCPWCAIGRARFETARAHFEHADEIELRWRSFELDPDAPAVDEVDMATRLANKYGMSRDQALENQARLTEMAAAEGLEFNFDRAKRGNTFDAHRLLHHAAELGLQDTLKSRLFQAYFTDGEAIGEHDTLVRVASDIGIDAAEAADVLTSGRYGDDVRADEALARDLGVNGVPFFVVDNRYGISGAQGPDLILSALRKAWDEGAEQGRLEGGEVCEDDACAVPAAES